MYDNLTHLTKAPLLTKSEERRLLRQAQAGDMAARNRLVEANMRLVIQFAKPYSNCGIDLEDLVSEGTMGLIRSIDKYDPERGSFSTCAANWIRQAVSRAVDNKAKLIRLPSYMHEYSRKINKARYEIQQAGLSNDVEILAKWLSWPEKRLRKILTQLNDTLSLDEPAGDTTIGNLIPVEDADPLENMQEMLHVLTTAEREVLTMRMNEECLDKVKEATGMSRERIKSLEASALRKLADEARTLMLQSMVGD